MKILLCGLIMLSVVACNVEEFRSVDISVVAQGNLYGCIQESIFKSCSIITDNSDWQDLQSKMNSLKDVHSDFEETEIDFSRYDVVAVFDRIRTGSYYTVKLDMVEEKSMLYIKVKYEKVPNQQTLGSNVQSYLIVKIPKVDKSIQINYVDSDL
ncbi:MAG: hypothetical protein H6Q17_262 [Bacteroidetes bacterium]|nr:hypothetical protein [Bacteroidota bacterium]